MTAELGAKQKSLYEADYLQWIETTVEKLQISDYSNVDWDNLIEEIADMARSERKSLKSNLVVVLMHLLNWQYQPERRSGSWKGSIAEHRRRIRDDLKDSPSLKSYLEEVLAECYADAVIQASAETDLPVETFPPLCAYTVIEILDSKFFPQP